MSRLKHISANLVAGLLLLTGCAFAQNSVPPGFPEPADQGPMVKGPRGVPAQDLLNMKGGDRPVPLTKVTIEQRLDSQLPLDAPFRDEQGNVAPLGKFFGKRPVVLALVYYDCPMLCTQILNGVVRAKAAHAGTAAH